MSTDDLLKIPQQLLAGNKPLGLILEQLGEFLSVLQTRADEIDRYYYRPNADLYIEFENPRHQFVTLPAMLLLVDDLPIENRCQLLRELLDGYSFSVHTPVFPESMISLIGFSSQLTDSKEWFQILLDHGAEVNSYAEDPRITSVVDGTIEYYGEDHPLVELLRKQGAVTGEEMVYEMATVTDGW